MILIAVVPVVFIAPTIKSLSTSLARIAVLASENLVNSSPDHPQRLFTLVIVYYLINYGPLQLKLKIFDTFSYYRIVRSATRECNSESEVFFFASAA